MPRSLQSSKQETKGENDTVKKPYLKLRHLIEDEGFDIKDLPALTGIPRSTLNDLINAPESAGTWRWKHIVSICRVLHIPQDKIGEYFFPRVEKGESA